MRQNKSQKNDKLRTTELTHNGKTGNNMVQLRNSNRSDIN